jgi:hypothetical protein
MIERELVAPGEPGWHELAQCDGGYVEHVHERARRLIVYVKEPRMAGSKKQLPAGETPDQALERIAPDPADAETPAEAPTIRERIAAIVEELRQPDGRGATRDISLAINALEDAELRLLKAGIQ